ncbi:MAG: potassium transporter KefB [candidate division Zixibacteria bacterium]|nr:potassium transporter KefB [candidate division Zixibacteria bacterium]
MSDIVYLRDFVVIIAIAVAVVAILHRIGIPTIAGFIFAGVIVGPHALGVVGDPREVELLAEIGVALLLFGIGLELSLDRLKRLWRPIIIGGALQVGITILAAFFISRAFGLAINVSILIGCLLAVSSTAIVLRGLEVRGEIDAPHGRLTLGILVFQDLLVVPMILLVPIISGSGSDWFDIATTLLRAFAILVGVLIAARLVVPRVLHLVAKTRQRQLFLLTVLLVCIGTAWITSSAGVSLALGAFLAGLVVAGSEYRHQVLADMIPFKEVFTSVFFISIGMLLSPMSILENIVPILLLLGAILIGKSFIVFITGLIMRLPVRVAILAAAALAQVGEFSFVVSKAAQDTGLLTDNLAGIIISAAILSMFITPFALAFGPQIAAGVGKVPVLTRLLKVVSVEDAPEKILRMQNHLIIGGYGFTGEKLAESLKACEIPYLIIELNPVNVRRAVAKGDPAYYGDITSTEVLEHLGLASARELVLVINDPRAIERAIKSARRVAPNLHITVRTNYLLDVKPLLDAGANEVVPAELEAAVEITSRIINRCDISPEEINAQLSTIRGKWLEEDL